MDQITHFEAAEALRRAHHGPRLLLLPNAWDVISARQFEAAGFEAIATTSGGVAWSLGYPDGERAPWSEVVAATRRIVNAVRAPVTADIETGYGATPAEVAKNVADILGAGASGFNIEDGVSLADRPLRPIEDAAARIRAAREAATAFGVPAVINARIDVYQKGAGEPAQRFEETVQRAKAYFAAGADCVYPIGLGDMDTIARLVKALNAPINIVARSGSPPAADFERIGVARISIATGATLAVMSLIQTMARTLRDEGRLEAPAPSVNRAQAQALFAPRDR